MSYKNPTSRDDPQTLEKLQAKKEECEKLQIKMKSVNSYYKKNSTCVGHPELTEDQARKLEASMYHLLIVCRVTSVGCGGSFGNHVGMDVCVRTSVQYACARWNGQTLG